VWPVPPRRAVVDQRHGAAPSLRANSQEKPHSRFSFLIATLLLQQVLTAHELPWAPSTVVRPPKGESPEQKDPHVSSHPMMMTSHDYHNPR
jgi:hypothetical protein